MTPWTSHVVGWPRCGKCRWPWCRALCGRGLGRRQRGSRTQRSRRRRTDGSRSGLPESSRKSTRVCIERRYRPRRQGEGRADGHPDTAERGGNGRRRGVAPQASCKHPFVERGGAERQRTEPRFANCLLSATFLPLGSARCHPLPWPGRSSKSPLRHSGGLFPQVTGSLFSGRRVEPPRGSGLLYAG